MPEPRYSAMARTRIALRIAVHLVDWGLFHVNPSGYRPLLERTRRASRSALRRPEHDARESRTKPATP